MSRTGVSLDKVQSWLRGGGERGQQGKTAKGCGISLGDDENVVKLSVLMVIQLCNYTKNPQSIHCEGMNCTVNECYLNKAF